MFATLNIRYQSFLCALFLCVLAAAPALAATAVPTAPSIAAVNGTQLIVQKRNSDGTLSPAAAYIIRGVTWDPATAAPRNGPNPIGAGTVPYGFFFDWPGRTPSGHDVLNFWQRSQFTAYYQKDLPLMAQMNVNTIRVYSDMGNTAAQTLAVLDECYRQGIMVVMTVAISQTEIDSQMYVNKILQYKNHPAILMWALGNEWNLNSYFGYPTMLQAMAATNAAAAAIKNIDPNHPVSSSLGDRFSSSPISCPVNDPCCSSPEPLSDIPSIVAGTPNIDLWGLNMYRGNSFNDLFAQWKRITAKPFYIGEFGVDAFNSQSFSIYNCNVAANVSGQVNLQKQSDYDMDLWQELTLHLSARSPVEAAIGGFVHQFNDALWKSGSFQVGLGDVFDYNGSDGIAGTADDDASYAKYNSEGFLAIGGFPDNVSNEEYYGLVNSSRAKRTAYNTLQDLYGNFPNLLLNAGFERQKAQWSGVGIVDCTVHRTGACALKITGPGNTIATPSTHVVMGQKYIFSGAIKTGITTASPTAQQGVRIVVQWFDGYGFLLQTQFLNTFINGMHDWQVFNQTWVTPAQAVYARVVCQVAGPTTIGDAWFDDLSIVPSN